MLALALISAVSVDMGSSEGAQGGCKALFAQGLCPYAATRLPSWLCRASPFGTSSLQTWMDRQADCVHPPALGASGAAPHADRGPWGARGADWRRPYTCPHQGAIELARWGRSHSSPPAVKCAVARDPFPARSPSKLKTIKVLGALHQCDADGWPCDSYLRMDIAK